MWKIVVGFVIFAALGMYVIIQGGDKLEMGGETHGVIETPEHKPADQAPVEPPAAQPAVPADATAK